MNSAVKIWGPTNVCFLTGINNYGSCCRSCTHCNVLWLICKLRWVIISYQVQSSSTCMVSRWLVKFDKGYGGVPGWVRTELGMQLGSSPAERLYSPILPPAPYILALRLLPPLFCSPILVPSLYFLTCHSHLTKPVPHTGKQQLGELGLHYSSFVSAFRSILMLLLHGGTEWYAHVAHVWSSLIVHRHIHTNRWLRLCATQWSTASSCAHGAWLKKEAA